MSMHDIWEGTDRPWEDCFGTETCCQTTERGSVD